MAKNFLGYQIETKDGNHNIPEEFYSFQVLSMATVDDFFNQNETSYSRQFKIVPIYEGDIEGPFFI